MSFEPYGQLHFLAAGGRDYAPGDRVLYPSGGGLEVATVVWRGESDIGEGVPTCAGPATDSDLARDEEHQYRRARAAEVARALIRRHGLAMKLLAVDYLDDDGRGERLTVVYYRAPERVDFRALLGDLVRVLRTRIDLRQVGDRDAARLLGGVGMCGRVLCCAGHLRTVDPVSLRLARTQDVAANGTQHVGACGRPACCLRFEQDSYEDFRARAPRMGATVSTPDGTGRVVGYQVPLDAVVVADSGGERRSCPLGRVCPIRSGRALRRNEGVRTGQERPSRQGGSVRRRIRPRSDQERR